MQAMLGRLANHLSGKQQEEIFVNNNVYKLAGVIGEGRFSKVYKAEYGRGWVAVKRTVVQEEEVWRARRELGLLRKLVKVGCVVSLIEGCVEGDSVTIVMELCGGSAMQLVRKHHEADEDVPSHTIFSILLSCTKALAALHSFTPPIAHRDIKLENLLSTPKPTVWKLCDFGSISTEALKCTTPEQVAKAQEDIETHTTLAYRAPEITDLWRHERADQQVDIWSVGVMFYVLCFKEFPFEEQPLAILNKKPQIPSYADPQVAKLIVETLSKNPAHRPDVWHLHNKLGVLSKDAFTEIKRPQGWSEQPLAAWCLGRVDFRCDDDDDGPIVAPSTPVERDLEAYQDDGDEDYPCVDESDEVPQVHMVVGWDEGEAKVERSLAARLKDWVEVQGVMPGKALTMLHADTPHAWVIKVTDKSFSHLRTLYLNKILKHVSYHGLASIFHYLSLRPIYHDAVIAYKSLCLIHHILRESPVTLHRQLHSTYRSLFTDLHQKWSINEDDRLPSLPSVIVKYTDYLRKRLTRFIKTGSLEAETDEESAQLGELFNCGVDLAMDLTPPLRNKAVLYNSCLVLMVLDLDEINSFLKVAPLKGGRFGMIEIEVAQSRKSFAKFTESIERHMPELKLLNKAAEEEEAEESPGEFDVEEIYYNLPYEADAQIDMNEVSRRLGNETCFDCQERPSAWASSGIGVFLCGCCYQYHDVVPFSKVKSILLDRWTSEQVSFLARVGNMNALPIWFGYPPESIPNPETDNDAYQSFVYDKYVRRSFLKQPDPFTPKEQAVASQEKKVAGAGASAGSSVGGFTLDKLFGSGSSSPPPKDCHVDAADALFPPSSNFGTCSPPPDLFSQGSLSPPPDPASLFPPSQSGNLDMFFPSSVEVSPQGGSSPHSLFPPPAPRGGSGGAGSLFAPQGGGSAAQHIGSADLDSFFVPSTSPQPPPATFDFFTPQGNAIPSGNQDLFPPQQEFPPQSVPVQPKSSNELTLDELFGS